MALGLASAAVPTPATNKMNSLLLKMPLEIRNMIWKHVLVQEEEIKPTRCQLFKITEGDREDHSFMNHPSKEKVLSLARVCRSINTEATPLYYQQNTFRFYRIEDMQSYLSTIGLDHRRQIRNITFHWKNTKSTKECFTLLKDCTALRQLTAYVWGPSLVWKKGILDNRDLHTLKDLQTFRQLRVAQPSKFTLSISQPQKFADISGEPENAVLERFWRNGDMGNYGLDGSSCYFAKGDVEEFNRQLQMEITGREVCERELERKRVPEQYLPGTRFSKRTQGQRIDYAEIEEMKVETESEIDEMDTNTERDVDTATDIDTENETEENENTELEDCLCMGCFCFECTCGGDVQKIYTEMDVDMGEAFSGDEEMHEEGCDCLRCVIGDDL